MATDSQTLIDLINYLNSRKGDYPGGVPFPLAAASRSRVDFLVPDSLMAGGLNYFFNSKEGHLLQAAVEKGLKLKLTDVSFLKTGQIEAPGEQVSSAPLVIMGSPQHFEDSEKVKDLCSALREPGRPVIQTAAPGEILADTEIKKEFWRDLKKVISIINDYQDGEEPLSQAR